MNSDSQRGVFTPGDTKLNVKIYVSSGKTPIWYLYFVASSIMILITLQNIFSRENFNPGNLFFFLIFAYIDLYLLGLRYEIRETELVIFFFSRQWSSISYNQIRRLDILIRSETPFGFAMCAYLDTNIFFKNIHLLLFSNAKDLATELVSRVLKASPNTEVSAYLTETIKDY